MGSTQDNSIELISEPSALSPALPGAAELDQELIDRAVEHINSIYTSRGLQMARELGEYVVEAFFGGDLDAVKQGSRRHATWRALAERTDLLVSHSNLWSSVQVLHQLRQLPEDVGASLSLSHHRRLLVVKDQKAKARLAEAVVSQGLTVKQLEAKVAKQRKKEQVGERRGRKPLPSFVKVVRALKRMDLSSDDISDEVLDALPDAEVEEMVEALDEQIEALETLKARIGAERA